MLAVMWVIVVGDGHQVVHGDIEGLAELKEEIGGEVDALGLQTAHVPVADAAVLGQLLLCEGLLPADGTELFPVKLSRHSFSPPLTVRVRGGGNYVQDGAFRSSKKVENCRKKWRGDRKDRSKRIGKGMKSLLCMMIAHG